MDLFDASSEDGARAVRALESDIVAWLTSVREDGTPQSSPVWFWWDGESFIVFSQPDKPKLQNIEANPRVSLHLVGDPLADQAVVLEGDARVHPEIPTADRHAEYLAKYREQITALGMDPKGFAESYSVPIRIDPTRARVW